MTPRGRTAVAERPYDRHQLAMMQCSIGAPKEGLVMMLAPACADPVSIITLERELLQLQQLRQRILESLASGLQGRLQRRRLRVELLELDRSIASIRGALAWAA